MLLAQHFARITDVIQRLDSAFMDAQVLTVGHFVELLTVVSIHDIFVIVVCFIEDISILFWDESISQKLTSFMIFVSWFCQMSYDMNNSYWKDETLSKAKQ